MSINNNVTGSRQQYNLKVYPDGSLKPIGAINSFVGNFNKANVGNKNKFIKYRLGSEGQNAGITLLGTTDGSVTPVEFYATSDIRFDFYVTDIQIILRDMSDPDVMLLNEFANLPALTNGFDLHYEENNQIKYLIEKAKTNGDIILQTAVSRPFGNGVELQLLQDFAEDLDDGFFINFRLDQIVPGGIRVGRGTTDRIVCTVRDNLTGLDDSWIDLLGYHT